MANEEKGTPDLSKIVSMIMERPDLISEIANLGKSKDSGEVTEIKAAEEPKPLIRDTPEANPSSASMKRARLLYALKPYLSESRAAAVDSILTFDEVFDLMRKKK